MKKTRIVFVEPRGAPSNVFAKYMTIPLLGPVYLGTIAKKAGFNVAILNENILGRDITTQELATADILCLSCITTTINNGKEIAGKYKEIRSSLKLKSRVIVGGIHASMLPDDVSPYFDQVIVGEAETVICDVLSGNITDHIVYGKPLEDLDSLPIPDFNLIQGWEKTTITPVMTSRGCPYQCNFCSVTKMFGRGYHAQSPERVIKEIMGIRKGNVFFADDHFTANIKRTNRLLDLMIKSRFNLPWHAQVRTEVTKKPELVAKMRTAGCRVVYVGFESINAKSLEDMHKSHSVEDIKRSIRVFKEKGILVHGMFMLGNDPDTKDVFKLTSDFCSKSGLDYAQYTILTPLPGTELYKRLEHQGRLLHKNWTYYDALHVVFQPKHMTARELQQGMVECFNEFYSYTNAVNDALNTAFNTGLSLIKKLYKRVYFPSFKPSFMKIAGRGIVNSWVSKNKFYFDYLCNFPFKPQHLK